MSVAAGPDLGELVPWVKAHSRVSVYTLRRRFRLSRVEADAIVAALVGMRVLQAAPEGESHRVRYSARTRKPRRSATKRLDRRTIVRTTCERGELPVCEAAEAKTQDGEPGISTLRESRQSPCEPQEATA